jgi:hypothetical protein
MEKLVELNFIPNYLEVVHGIVSKEAEDSEHTCLVFSASINKDEEYAEHILLASLVSWLERYIMHIKLISTVSPGNNPTAFWKEFPVCSEESVEEQESLKLKAVVELRYD